MLASSLIGLVASLAACAPSMAAGPHFNAALWTSADVGAVGVPGSLQIVGPDRLQVTASGADIWGDADAFHFVYQHLDGDVDVRARLERLERTDGWAKVGVMVRSSLGADAMHALVDVVPDGAAEFITRTEAGGSATSIVRYGVSFPTWVRVVRKGQIVTGYVSSDGDDWVEVGSVAMDLGSDTYVGLAVTSHVADRATHALVSGLELARPGIRAVLPEASISQQPWVCPDAALSPAYEPTLFVSTSGSDSNDGRSALEPLRTLARAAELVHAGDVVWIRGGVYSADVELKRSGSAGAPIVFESFPGECAVIDGSGLRGDQRLTLAGVRYNVVRNVIVRNSPAEGIFVVNSDLNVLSNILTFDNGESGILNLNSSGNVYQYVISHDNYNPPGGGDADGISISTGNSNRISHCVVYGNSDDGVDTWKSTDSVVERCLSFKNGFQGGDGIGFKAGGGTAVVRTLVRESVAFGNKGSGFDHNRGLGVRFENDTAYANGGYGFISGQGSLLNNLSFANQRGDWYGNGYDNEEITNSWNVGIGRSPFVSTDPGDGDFLSPAGTGPAAEAGTDIGLPFLGSAPDLGAIPVGRTIATTFGVSLIAFLSR